MTSLDTPTTEAGRAMLGMIRQAFTSRERMTADGARTIIAAIEAEAIANHDAALRVAITQRADLICDCHEGSCPRLAAVLALLSEGTPEPGLDAAWREARSALPDGWRREQPEKETP